MNIVVLIKQVPDVDDIKWTKENNLDRSQMLSKTNKYDEWALNWALKFKDKFKDVKVTAVSMGPNQAKEVLFEAISKGADRAILVSDKLFQGSDTLATAKILAKTIEKYVNDFNIIIAGQMAQDGDTAQTPVSVAKLLNIADIENVVEIINADKNQVLVSQKTGDIVNMAELKTPCLISINKECETVPKVKINDYIKAQDTIIEIVTANDLKLDKSETGITGSPTMVYRAYKNEINKDTKEIKENIAKELLDFILKV